MDTDQASLPAITATGSPQPSTKALKHWLDTLPARLSDTALATLETIASSPLPVLAPCDEAHFLQGLRILYASLPKRPTDKLSGKLMAEGYKLKLLHLPCEAIDHMVTIGLESRFFPSIAECLEIVSRWTRADAVMKAKAEGRARAERHARLDETMRRFACGTVDQASLDAMPERTKQIAETRGFIRSDNQGGYRLRPEPEPFADLDAAQAIAVAAARFPSTRSEAA